MLLKDQHFQYLTPPVNDAQTSKLEINSSNHHAKTSKLVDIDFSAQNQNTTVNKQTRAQIPDISYEHNYANFQHNTSSHTNNNEFQSQNASVSRQTSTQIPDISCVHNDANVQQNTSSHSNSMNLKLKINMQV